VVPNEPASGTGAGSRPTHKLSGSEILPSFSPDGNQVAFAWNTSENPPIHSNFDIYLKLIDGSEAVRLTHDPADDLSPAWSPDGRYIAFLRTLSADRMGVFLIPAIGGRERKLADVDLLDESFSFPAFPGFPMASGWLSWTRLLLVSQLLYFCCPQKAATKEG
jgi:dipeptidyl aminopeptidase/acylaminoacyl peptidase